MRRWQFIPTQYMLSIGAHFPCIVSGSVNRRTYHICPHWLTPCSRNQQAKHGGGLFVEANANATEKMMILRHNLISVYQTMYYISLWYIVGYIRTKPVTKSKYFNQGIVDRKIYWSLTLQNRECLRINREIVITGNRESYWVISYHLSPNGQFWGWITA